MVAEYGWSGWWVWFAVGTQQLHVGVEDAFAPARKAHPALIIAPNELDALASRLIAAGVSVTWNETLPDTRRFFCSDPLGEPHRVGRRTDWLAEAP